MYKSYLLFFFLAMCLTIKQHPATKAPTTTINVFKAYYYTTSSTTNGFMLNGLHRGKSFEFRSNLRLISDRTNVNLTSDEFTYHNVSKGLHGFTTLKGLKSYLEDFVPHSKSVILQFSADPQHFVAKGEGGGVVYTQLHSPIIVGEYEGNHLNGRINKSQAKITELYAAANRQINVHV